jgi:hypothetical protein
VSEVNLYEQALRNVRFCPVCGGPLEPHYNIDINEVDGMECRKDRTYINVASVFYRNAQLNFFVEVT